MSKTFCITMLDDETYQVEMWENRKGTHICFCNDFKFAENLIDILNILESFDVDFTYLALNLKDILKYMVKRENKNE